MKRQSGEKTKGKSPYLKYMKTPYQYKFKNCSHSNEVHQSVPDWKGKVCSVCNIILEYYSNG